MSIERYRDLQTSGVMADQIQYGQILHYTRVNPVDPKDVRPYFSWMRSICPWDTKLSLSGWVAIERPTYDTSMLFAVAERVPRMIVSDEYVTETYERGEGAQVFQQQRHTGEHRLKIPDDDDDDDDRGTYEYSKRDEHISYVEYIYIYIQERAG